MPQGNAAKLARYAAIGIEFTSPSIAGALIGYYLDKRLGTQPWLTLTLLLVGIFAGFLRLFSLLKSFQRGL
jgi:ATP synthase protein I